MSVEITLPELGQGMQSGTIVRWLKAEGDTVRAREALYELDTDKVTQEIEAGADGVLLRILVAEGEVTVGSPVAVIGAPGESANETPPSPGEASPLPGDGHRQAQPPQPAAGTERPPARVQASPLARRVARENGVDLADVVGTGPDGRVVAEDVERAVRSAPEAPVESAAGTARPEDAAAGIDVVPLTATRVTIARRLTEAWEAPAFQLRVSADMSEVVALHAALVARTRDQAVEPSLSDILVKLVAAALVRHPAVNATFAGSAVHRSHAVDIGLAVAAPGGLVVPVLRNAERRSIAELAEARHDVVTRARAGRLGHADLAGGTFTISNLGMYGIEDFTAVLNPPQVAILAVGAIKHEAVVVDGEIDVAPIMRMTLTCDHRAIDGVDGAEFLRTLVALVERPALAL